MPLLQHPLQPLNVCLPSVVAEFKHQVQAAGISDLSGVAPPVRGGVGEGCNEEAVEER